MQASSQCARTAKNHTLSRLTAWCQLSTDARRLQVVLNEELDPELIIKRLKQEIRDFKDEIR